MRVVPITHEPSSEQGAIEVPAAIKTRLKLDDQKSWVITSEVNQFTWSSSPDLRPISRNQPDRCHFGLVPETMVTAIRQEIRNHQLGRTMTVTGRDESGIFPANS